MNCLEKKNIFKKSSPESKQRKNPTISLFLSTSNSIKNIKAIFIEIIMNRSFIVVKFYQHLRIKSFRLQASDQEKVNKISTHFHHPINSSRKLQTNSILQLKNQSESSRDSRKGKVKRKEKVKNGQIFKLSLGILFRRNLSFDKGINLC